MSPDLNFRSPHVGDRDGHLSNLDISWQGKMADRDKPWVKRFKTCRVRVRTQSTRGKKTTRNVPLKLNRSGSNASDSKLDVVHSRDENPPDFCEAHIPCSAASTSCSSKSSESGLSKYHQRRTREFNRWEEVRERLLQARIQEESFCQKILTCVICQQPAVCRCVECGTRQFFCMNCGAQQHHKRNYFHVLEVYEVL